MALADPPLLHAYKTLVQMTINESYIAENNSTKGIIVTEECELPLIDLKRLSQVGSDREECKQDIARASQVWGMFQVVNHGFPPMLLDQMKSEQMQIFNKPFNQKKVSIDSYRWGSPSAARLEQFSWSEAFHIPLTDISGFGGGISSAIKQFAALVTELGKKIIEILANNLGHDSTFFEKHCPSSSCYIRMNRYPKCPISSHLVNGLVPHTDSDFLTILLQDRVGGLQFLKDEKWYKVKTDPESLIINVGDLLQAWSNNFYKSVLHRVVSNPREERISAAYFVCPLPETVIESCLPPSIYRKFSFAEYKQQIQDDVANYGSKIGLSRFLVEA